MTRIGILGAAGRMGRAIADALANAPDAVLAGGIDRDGAIMGEHESAVALAQACDVLIDFSSPGALAGHIEAAVLANCPLLIGTTGLGAEHEALLDSAGGKIALLPTGNTSLGVNLLAALVEQAAARLGEDWDIEIVEMHHRHKVDAPSGTALLLGEAAARGRGVALADHSARGRDGITGARKAGDIGFASLRGGSVAGDHEVIFASDQERIEIGHRAESRAVFANGAVKAALWLAGKPAGRYTMRDVLGL